MVPQIPIPATSLALLERTGIRPENASSERTSFSRLRGFGGIRWPSVTRSTHGWTPSDHLALDELSDAITLRGSQKQLRADSIRSPAACRGWSSPAGHSFRNTLTIIDRAITRADYTTKSPARGRALHSLQFERRSEVIVHAGADDVFLRAPMIADTEETE
jgi:hypothetical protein